MEKELQELLEVFERPAVKKAFEEGFAKGFNEGVKEIEENRPKSYSVKVKK